MTLTPTTSARMGSRITQASGERHSRSCYRNGLTLVELLTTIAIIGVLVALLLPAVQSVRESGRRTQCANRLKQLALAALNYESGKKEFPVGSHNSFWRTWLVQIMPFVEETAFYDAYDHRPYLSESRFDRGVNADLTKRLFSEFSCPDDRAEHTTFNSGATAHSYVACTGNGEYVATLAGWNTTLPVVVTDHGSLHTNMIHAQSTHGNTSNIQSPIRDLSIIHPEIRTYSIQSASRVNAFRGGAYLMSGADENLTPPEKPDLLRKAAAVRVADITDGLSRTLAFSEVIRPRTNIDGQCHDYRGLSWWGPGALFNTHGTPNSGLPDVMPRLGDCISGEHPPCLCPHTEIRPISVLARSRHPGGVVAATCDGAVDFYYNEISANVWENLGTTQGDAPQ